MAHDQKREKINPTEFKYEFDSLEKNADLKSKLKYVSKLEEAIDYLSSLKSPEKIMEMYSSYEAIFYIDKVISYKSDLIDFALFSNRKCDTMFGDLLLYLYDSNESFDFKNAKIAFNEPNQMGDKNERYVSILFYLLDIISIIMCESLEFRVKFQFTNGLSALIKFISDRNFVRNNLRTTISGFFSNKFNIIDFIVSNINLMSKNCLINYGIWLKKLNSVDALIQIARDKSSCIDLAYSTIINISNDGSIIYNLSSNIMKDLIQKLKIMSADFKLGQFNRKSFMVEEDVLNGKNEIEIHFIVHNDLNSSSACFYIFDGLQKMARYLNLSNRMYFDFAIKELLKQIVVSSNQFERILILKLLVQLSFNEKIAQDLKKDADLFKNKFNFILKQCDLVTKENQKIKFLIEILKLISDDELQTSLADRMVNNEHIYLSYSKNCYISKKEHIINEINKISQFKFLFKINYSNIIEHIRMASSVILLVDQAYLFDLTCQIEANLALKLKKSVIPILVSEEDESLINESWVKHLIQNCKTIQLTNMDDLNNETLLKDSLTTINGLKASNIQLHSKLIHSLERIKCDSKVLK